MGSEMEAKKYEPTSSHKLTGLIIHKSIKLAMNVNGMHESISSSFIAGRGNKADTLIRFAAARDRSTATNRHTIVS
ncbi:hypothetical protein L1987_17143 [Smallanthus sonchifolius]|uniref:Uncharacterized protein n=1 Tax=Smallanthus sonchifolius TaxID=185202 RepID=A0ACB9IYK7_9ASTR|nr:hypothetical protein L1987_17143 [Smallanthus sonchifolius]